MKKKFVPKKITEDMKQITQDDCKHCRYGTFMSGAGFNFGDSWACYYIAITGHSRECPNGWCNKYEKRTKKQVAEDRKKTW